MSLPNLVSAECSLSCVLPFSFVFCEIKPGLGQAKQLFLTQPFSLESLSAFNHFLGTAGSYLCTVR